MSEVSEVSEVQEVKGLNYYERHLGDYAKETRHLSLLEHGVYTILTDYCFATGKRIPEKQIYRYACARTRGEKRAVDAVLAEFFKLEDGWYFSNMVASYKEAKDKRAQTSKENGKLGGRPAKKSDETGKPSDNNSLENEKPNQNLNQTYQEPNDNLKKPVPIAINPLVQYSINPIANSPLAINPEATSKSIALPPGNAAAQPYSARTFTAEFTLPEWNTASHSQSAPKATSTAKPVTADRAFDLKNHSPGPAADLTEPLADPDSHLQPSTAPLANENGAGKGITHADPNSARHSQKQTVSVKPAKPAPSVVQAEGVDEGNASTGKRGKKELTQEQKNLNATIWQRYSAAYFEKYGVMPLRNAKVNKQINDVRERLGHEAPDVAAYYLEISDSWLNKTGHPIGQLLQGCEGYRMQWATGRKINSVTARQMENTQANAEAAKQAVQALDAGWVNPLDALMAYAETYGDKTFNEIKALEAQR